VDIWSVLLDYMYIISVIGFERYEKDVKRMSRTIGGVKRGLSVVLGVDYLS